MIAHIIYWLLNGGNMMKYPRIDCPIDVTMSMIEGRWKCTILCKLLNNGPMRYNHLLKSIGGISPRIFTLQLKSLENDGLINRLVGQGHPVKVTYSVSEKGISLVPVLKALQKWGLENTLYDKIMFDPGTVGISEQYTADRPYTEHQSIGITKDQQTS